MVHLPWLLSFPRAFVLYFSKKEQRGRWQGELWVGRDASLQLLGPVHDEDDMAPISSMIGPDFPPSPQEGSWLAVCVGSEG